MPIGDNYTMGPDDAIRAIKLLNPRRVVPIHYNTFPLMNGDLVPPELLMLEPKWRNFFWNMATVQFDHRLIAVLVVVVAVALWWKIRNEFGLPKRVRWGGQLVLAFVVAQVALGILTLLLVVPLPLAALHQAGAVLVFAAALNVAHALR